MIDGQMHCETDARQASQPGAGQDMQAVPIYRSASTVGGIIDEIRLFYFFSLSTKKNQCKTAPHKLF